MATRPIFMLTDKELYAIIENDRISEDIRDEAETELEMRDEQREANNGGMNGVAPE